CMPRAKNREESDRRKEEIKRLAAASIPIAEIAQKMQLSQAYVWVVLRESKIRQMAPHAGEINLSKNREAQISRLEKRGDFEMARLVRNLSEWNTGIEKAAYNAAYNVEEKHSKGHYETDPEVIRGSPASRQYLSDTLKLTNETRGGFRMEQEIKISRLKQRG